MWLVVALTKNPYRKWHWSLGLMSWAAPSSSISRRFKGNSAHVSRVPWWEHPGRPGCPEEGGPISVQGARWGEFTERVAHLWSLKNQVVLSEREGEAGTPDKGRACARSQGSDQTWCLQETESGLQWLGQRLIRGMGYVFVVALPVLSKTSGSPSPHPRHMPSWNWTEAVDAWYGGTWWIFYYHRKIYITWSFPF